MAKQHLISQCQTSQKLTFKKQTMKKLIYALAIPVLLLTGGCNQKNIEINMLKAKNDSLTAITSVKDSVVRDFVNAFNDIQSNLDSIKMKEKIISKNFNGNSEIKSRTKDQINSDINLIYKLQQENKALVYSLRTKLKRSDFHSTELEQMADNLTKQIEEKDIQITQLRDELTKAHVQITVLSTQVGDLSTNVEDLTSQNLQKQQQITEKTAELNTAYYVMGTTKDLKDKKIITKEGGFVGLGRMKELAPEMNKSYFTRVDVTNFSALSIMKDKVAILSSHPKTSYRLSGKNSSDSLIITDQKQFWSLSKVLVLNVK